MSQIVKPTCVNFEELVKMIFHIYLDNNLQKRLKTRLI